MAILKGAMLASARENSSVGLTGGALTRAAQVLAAKVHQEMIVSNAAAYNLLASLLSPESRILRDESMARHTTLRVGGPADCYVEPASEEDLARLVRVCAGHNLPLVLIGRGSNLLVRDGGIRGVVVCLRYPVFCRLDIQPPLLTAGAGLRLKNLAVEARRGGLAGLEFLEGIPGSLGGALRMNAGAMGSSIFDRVKRLRLMTRSGQIEEHDASAVPVQYRCCPILQETIALSAVLQGHPESPEAIGQRMNAFSKKRWETQPAASSAGCMFKNPSALPAGKLIEELGLKGTRVGGAAVSTVHGNFIVNEGQATAWDIISLIGLIRERARAERGIDLESEVQIIGEDVV